MREIQIPVPRPPGSSVSASVRGRGDTVVALAHGAGGNRQTPLLERFADSLARSGRRVVLFNYPYVERGRRAPDPAATLEATSHAVAQYARDTLKADRLILGGKSMGGRIASQVVAQGTSADGLLLLGYPLHPAGKTDSLREGHLGEITAPMLFLQGTRDALARWDLIEAATRRLGSRARLHRVEGGDHSFAVLKRSGRTVSEVESELAEAATNWLTKLGL